MYELCRQIKDSRFSNWLDVAVGVSITTKGISDYLEATIVSLHHDIKYGACAGLPNCRHNCSRTEQNLSSWCPTCKDWKKQIMLHNKYKKRANQIKWSEINSSQWPYDINEMVKVFAPDWWKARTPYTEDLSVALHVFHNCKKFNILFEPCQRVRGVRNAHAHGQLEASDIEKKQALKDLVAFLKQPEISRTVSGKLAISQLKRLRSKSVIDLITKEESFKQHLAKALNPINKKESSMLDQNDIIQEMRLQLYKPKEDIVNRISRRPAALIGVFVPSLLLFTFLFTFYWNKSVNTGLKEKDCLPMTFSSPCPWKPDFTFDSYLSDSPTLFGRKWLINKIQFSLMATSSRGIMLTAEMGYGKSTLVSNLLCDDELLGGSRLHKYVLSYHICKFDVISTQKPEYFIKNLVGMLISKLPEAGNAILTDELAMRFLQTSKCAEDPVGCIDVAIIHPLRTLTFNEERYVIIDAMDECGESAAITMSLLDVLSKRISKLPRWLKFFITSRDIDRVTSRLPGMQRLHETSKNVQNRKDVATFIDSVMSIHQTSLTRLFGEYIDTKKVRKHILRIGGSNFLYVDLAVKFWIESPHSKLSDIPQSLNEFYAMNLDRVFGDNEHLYGLARNVFEVLCISYQGLELEELEAILNVTACPYELRNLLGNQIAHFVTHKHYIRIYHKAICDYLTNNGSAYHKYHISISNGHTLFANYLLRKYNNSIEDILDLFIHVAESKDSDLLHSLQHSNYFLRMNLSSIKHLHQMAKTRNSFLGTKLLIRALGRQHIDSLTSANVTATFLAAAFGNSETLRALIDENGNYSFRVGNPPNKGGLEDAVNHCKYKTLWGYGLLDIASQNGHTEVINVLLAKNQTLLYSKNGLGLTAVHLAAEHGHVHILDTFLEKDNTQADHHLLYLASKNGHLSSVITLLRHGVKDSCVCCGDKLHWISNNTKRMQWHPCYNTSDGIQCVTYIEDENATFVLNDDLRLVKCTTALEIALQNGYNKIASHLLLQIPNALSCREYGGRTAFLTAVKYNQSDVVDIMLKKGANVTDKCERAFNVTVRYSLRFFSVNEIIALENDMCPLGTTVEHFVATSGNKDIAERLRNKGIYLNWRVQDESGNTPLHYAACNNEWEMLIYMINTGNGDIYLEAKNGSLPIHSAVLCNAIMSYAALQQYHARSNRILIDNEGRGLFHYLVSGSEHSKDVNAMIYMLTSDKYKLNTSTTDKHSNNFLHYAADIGNHYIITVFCVVHNASRLLVAENNVNKTVIDIAFDKLLQQQNVRLCFNCLFGDQNFQQENMTKEERVISQIFQIISEHSYIQKVVDFSKYHRLAVLKGNTLVRHIVTLNQPKPLILPMDTDLITEFFLIEQPPVGMISLLSDFVFDFCNKSLEKSLIHRVIRNDNNKYWIYFSDAEEMFNVLKSKTMRFWDTCYDRDGYNILHHAVMGGNYETVKFLLSNGLTLSGPPLSKVTDLISLGVTHADIYKYGHLESRPWMVYEKYVLGVIHREKDWYWSVKNFDATNTYILSQMMKSKKVKFAHLCMANSKRLSLVHWAAIKGQLSLLKTMHNAFGQRVLQCTNFYQFTPLYFAKIFNHSDIVKVLKSKCPVEILPQEMAELLFLQSFAASNVTELINVPIYVHFIVRLMHPYLYQVKTTNSFMFYRSLARMCFDLSGIIPELSAMLQAFQYIPNDLNDILSKYSNETLDKVNLTRDVVDDKSTLREIFKNMTDQTIKFNRMIARRCNLLVMLLRYTDFVLVRRKVSTLFIDAIYETIRMNHQLLSHFQFSVIKKVPISAFHVYRITNVDGNYTRHMTLHAIKDFYAFRRKFFSDMGTKYFPSKFDVSEARFHTLDNIIRLYEVVYDSLLAMKNFDKSLTKLFDKTEQSISPLDKY